MAKNIYTLVDTNDVRDYLINNTELLDDDESMTSEELDQLIDRIVDFSATSGKLHDMLRDAFSDSWLFEKLLDVVDDCMYDFVSECISDMDEMGE